MDENWFYLDPKLPPETRRIGPLSRLRIEELASQGVISKADLLWYPGLVTWLSWKEISPDYPGNSPTHTCFACMSHKPEAELLYQDRRWRCKNCGPTANTASSNPSLGPTTPSAPRMLSVPSEIYASFGIRLAATLIDLMILGIANAILVMLYLFVFHIPQDVLEKSLAINIPGLMLEAAYQIYFLSQYGGTPGKMLLGLRVVRADGSPLGVSGAITRYIAFWVTAFTFGAGFLIIFFDPQRRALHDHIAGTRVQFFRASIR